MFHESAAALNEIFDGVGYLVSIMADKRKNQEFLGGGPKFNTVGKDVRGENEVIVPASQSGYWLKLALIGLVVVVLAGVLFFLNDRSPGRTQVPAGHGGHGIAPDGRPSSPSDSNFR